MQSILSIKLSLIDQSGFALQINLIKGFDSIRRNVIHQVNLAKLANLAQYYKPTWFDVLTHFDAICYVNLA